MAEVIFKNKYCMQHFEREYFGWKYVHNFRISENFSRFQPLTVVNLRFRETV